MKKLTAALTALLTLMLPAFAYADVAYPGSVRIGGARVMLIPIILIIALIVIAIVIICRIIRRRKK